MMEEREQSVLIVDDALFMRMMLKKIIAGEGGYCVYEAPDGETALELYRQHRPQIVLLDISMPGMNGIEVLKCIREADPQAYVVMCSAIGQESMIMEAINSGAASFIVKPFLPEHIIKALENAPVRQEG